MVKSIIGILLLTSNLWFLLSCNKISLEEALGGEPLPGRAHYVATWGDDNNLGNFDSPWLTFQKAIEMSIPGDTVYFRGGVWYPTKTIRIEPYTVGNYGKSGKPDSMICYFNYPGEVPVFDFSKKLPEYNFNTGMIKAFADFISMRGMVFRNLWQLQEEVEVTVMADWCCSNFNYENMTIHDCGGAGFRNLAGLTVEGGDPPWHRYDYDTLRYINCDAYNLCDSFVVKGNPTGNKADGWKTANYRGAYTYWYGCRAWNCSDDGFDPSGSQFRDFYYCWSFNIGHLNGDGYGWKCTGPAPFDSDIQTLTLRIVNCISAYNRDWGIGEQDAGGPNGYAQNVAIIYNNIAYKNKFGMGNNVNNSPSRDNIYRNNIAYESTNKEGTHYEVTFHDIIEDHNSWLEGNYYSGKDRVSMSDTDFVSLIPLQLTGHRKADGSLPDINFLKLKNDSPLKQEGTYVGMSNPAPLGVDWEYIKSKGNRR